MDELVPAYSDLRTMINVETVRKDYLVSRGGMLVTSR